MKRLKHRLISRTEGAVFTVAFATLIIALIASLFLAQYFLVATAQYWDFLRVERYLRLCQMALEAEARTWPSEESLQKLREIGLYPDVYPPDHEIPQPNPRYVPAIESVEIWGHIRDAEGKPVAVLRLSRHDINTRHTVKMVRLYTLVGAIGGTILIGIIGLFLHQGIIRRLRGLSREIDAHLPSDAKATNEDPLESLSHSVRALISSQAEKAAKTRAILDNHSELAVVGSVEGQLIDFNAAYCRYFDITREEAIGSNYLDYIQPAYRMEVLGHLRSLNAANPQGTIEHPVTMRDGSTRWLRWQDKAVFGNDGKVREIISFGTDITAEKNLADRIDALRRAFDQMQSLAETGSLTWDFAADRMEWTPETRRLLGVDAAAPACLENLLTVVAPDDRETMRRLFQEAREQGRDFQNEFRAVLPDGSLRFLQSRAEVLADSKTKLLNNLTCTLRDITALRDAEAATKRELRFREAVEQSMGVGIVVSDEKGRNLLVNAAFCRMTGWSREELVGISAPYPYWPEEAIPAINEAFEQAIAGKAPDAGFELRFCRKDGTRFDALVKVAPLLDSEDHQLGWLGAVTDISAIQQTRRELLKAEAAVRAELQYRQAVEKAITVGLIAINKEGRPISVNDAYCRMFGYTRQEIMGMAPPYPLWPEEEQEKIENAFAQHLAGQSPPEGFSLRFKRKDGRLVDVLIRASTLYDAHGQAVGVLSALTDVTPLQEAQRSLRETHDRLQIAQDVAEFGIWDWDPVNHSLHWDRQSFAMFGRPDATDAEEVWRTVHSEEEQERLTYELQRLIATGGKSGQDRLRVRWPDGSLHDILSTYVILRDPSGRATRVLGVNRDVTAELEEERELRNAQERLAAALEGGRFGTFEHVIGLGDLNWNPANYEINGIDPAITDPAELFSAWKEVTGDFFQKLMAQMSALPVAETNFSYEFTARPRGKDPRRIRVSIFIERNDRGHPVRLVGVTRRLD